MLPFFKMFLYKIVAGSDVNSWFSGFGPNVSVSSPTSLFTQLVNESLPIITAIAVGVVIYSGFLYVTSAGDEGKVKKAQLTMTYALAGLIIVFVAGLIVKFTLQRIGAIPSNNTNNSNDNDNFDGWPVI